MAFILYIHIFIYQYCCSFIRLRYFQVNGNLTVDGIQYYITDNFGEGMYESCAEVKFGTMNTLAMEFIGAGATNFTGTLSLAHKHKHISKKEVINSATANM